MTGLELGLHPACPALTSERVSTVTRTLPPAQIRAPCSFSVRRQAVGVEVQGFFLEFFLLSHPRSFWAVGAHRHVGPLTLAGLQGI